MTRYFRHETGYISTDGGSRSVEWFEALGFTEVQVVPVDAQVVTPSKKERLSAWERVAGHPFFLAAYAADGVLVDAMIDQLDALVDAIVIRREDVPEVQPMDGLRPFVRASARPNVYSIVALDGAEDPLAHVEGRMREFAALAEYLREHPTVDEAQVAAIRAVLDTIPNGHGDRDRVARALAAAGARIEGAHA